MSITITQRVIDASHGPFLISVDRSWHELTLRNTETPEQTVIITMGQIDELVAALFEFRAEHTKEKREADARDAG